MEILTLTKLTTAVAVIARVQVPVVAADVVFSLSIFASLHAVGKMQVSAFWNAFVVMKVVYAMVPNPVFAVIARMAVFVVRLFVVVSPVQILDVNYTLRSNR